MVSRILLARAPLTVAILTISLVGFTDAFLAATSTKPPTQLFSSATAAAGTAPMLKSVLKKPSKVLTVGVEYSNENGDAADGLEVLSMKLRQQSKVSFVVCSNLDTIKLLSQEQESARGNFPGPVPIVCQQQQQQQNIESMENIAAAGASAVIVDAGNENALLLAESASSAGLETIWKVSSVEQATQILDSIEADVFLLDETTPEILKVIPKSSMAIGTLHEPMQEDGAEIETGKEFKAMGCSSVLVEQACVGDKEDIDYASFLVSGLTSKASKEFKFSGLTGSTNGHFGGIQSNSSVQWDRKRLVAEKESEEEE